MRTLDKKQIIVNMKYFLVAFFAVAAVASAAFLPLDQTISLKGNVIDNLITKALEYIRLLLKNNEPYTIPSIPTQHIVDKDIDINVALENVKISKASGFTIDHIENNLPKLWAKFGLTIPTMHLEGDYTVTGMVAGKAVQGKGSAKADIEKFVQNGYIKVTITRHEVQMTQLDLDYDLKGLKIDFNGLSIQGMSKDDVETLINKQFLDFLQTNKKDVEQIVSKHVLEKANELMKGKSLKELLDFLKKMIDPSQAH